MHPSTYLLAAVIFVVPTHTIARLVTSIRKAAPQAIAASSAGPRWVAKLR